MTTYGSGLYGAGLYSAGGLSSARATATATARAGTIKLSQHVTGSRALATARARPGDQLIAPPPTPHPYFPSLLVMLDITNDPTNSTRVWTNITAYVRECSLVRDGRSNETERTQTGSCSLLLDNRDGRFTPQNSASPYYPNMKTTRWLQVRAIWQGTTYYRWTGIVELIANSWPGVGRDSVVEMQGSTALKVLNLTPLDGASYPAQPSGARVTAVVRTARLDTATVETGSASLPALAPEAGSGITALQHLQALEAEEQGIVFSTPTGVIAFQDRHHRLGATTAGTIGDAAGEIRYQNPMISTDDQLLFTSAHRTTSDDETGSALDSTAGTLHFARDNTQTMLTDDVNEAQAAAEAFVFRYKEAPQRVSQVDIMGSADPTKWATILSATNGNQYRFLRRYPVAGTISQLVFLEQVAERMTPGPSWDTTWMLSPGTIDSYWNSVAWRVGDPVYGQFMNGSIAIGW